MAQTPSIFDFTINSTDPENYHKIFTNISGRQTRECNLIVTSLTTNCNIVVLNTTDYFTINDEKYTFTDEYTSMDVDTLVGLMNTLASDFTFAYDTCNRVSITSTSKSISLDDCSYNVKILLGLYNYTFPLTSTEISTKHILQLKDVGAFLSTPVLYLASNIGQNSFKNINSSDSLTSTRIVMRLNNSYSSAYPIFATNGDFNVRVLSTDLSDIRFTLVDANYVEVKLLNPMYITINIELIEDVEENPLIIYEKSAEEG